MYMFEVSAVMRHTLILWHNVSTSAAPPSLYLLIKIIIISYSCFTLQNLIAGFAGGNEIIDYLTEGAETASLSREMCNCITTAISRSCTLGEGKGQGQEQEQGNRQEKGGERKGQGEHEDGDRLLDVMTEQGFCATLLGLSKVRLFNTA